MELRQIIQFAAVADERNFRRAAERLHMSQPPLSQAIRRLEKELGVRLFDRTSRSVELTEAGKVFLTESRRLLTQLDAAVLETQLTAQGRVGKLTIGFTVPWAYEVLPTILQQFGAAHPNVALALREIPSSEQVRNLLDRTLDVGFLRLPRRYAPKGIRTIPLRKDKLAVVLPEGHHLRTAKSLTIGDLQNEKFILPPFKEGPDAEQLSFRMQIMNLCMEAGYAPRIAQEANQMQTIVRLIETGLGISLIPRWAERHFPSTVVYKDLAGNSDLSRLSLAAAWNPDNSSPVLNRFLETIRETPRG